MASVAHHSGATRPTQPTGWGFGPSTITVARAASGAAPSVHRVEVAGDPAEWPSQVRQLMDQVGGVREGTHRLALHVGGMAQHPTVSELVAAVLDAMESALPGGRLEVFDHAAALRPPESARRQPWAVAGSATPVTARLLSSTYPDALLIRVGSRTTTVTPIAGGEPAPWGRTDAERLAAGELIPGGVVATPVEAVLQALPWRSHSAPVLTGKALMGDVHLWTRELEPGAYRQATPDRTPTDRPHAGERLARLLGGDRQLLREGEVDRIAAAAAEAQLALIEAALGRVRSRHPGISAAVCYGPGAWIGARAAQRSRLEVATPATLHGVESARFGAAVAAALLDRELPARSAGAALPASPARGGLVLIKIGGGVLLQPDALPRIGAALSRAAQERPLVIVPGGGPFTDRVRQFDQDQSLDPEAAHWMAILGMDQYAWVLAGAVPAGQVVTGYGEVHAALAAGQVPILAPARWLRASDEVPHSWLVTSDSLAAYLAALVGAAELILVKPVTGGAELLDGYFAQALAAGLPWSVIGLDAIDELPDRLRSS